MVKHFRELRVYGEAFDAAMRIFECSKEWPKASHTHALTHPQTRGRTTNAPQALDLSSVALTKEDETLISPTNLGRSLDRTYKEPE
jgi:hypothetical protein